jgi:hydroxymethylbilane synthase
MLAIFVCGVSMAFQLQTSASPVPHLSITKKATVTIGTRGSPLALAQAYETKRLLGKHFPELAAEGAVAIQKIMTKVSLYCVKFFGQSNNCFYLKG